MQTLSQKNKQTKLYTCLSVRASTNTDISWNVLIWTRQGSAHYISEQTEPTLSSSSFQCSNSHPQHDEALSEIALSLAGHEPPSACQPWHFGLCLGLCFQCQSGGHLETPSSKRPTPLPPDIQPIANVTKQPAFCPLKASCFLFSEMIS